MKSLYLTENDIWDTSLTQIMRLGQSGVTADGRKYRYAGYGGTITPGLLLAAAAPVANHLAGSVAVNAAIGAQEVQVTVGATAVTQNQYAGGVLSISDGVGAGQEFRIIGNTAAASSGTTTVKIEGRVTTALTSATSKAGLIASKYSGLVASATLALVRVGVTLTPGASGTYAWVQSGGDTSALAQGAVTIAQALIPSATVAGASAAIGTNAATDQIIGFARQAIADTKFGLVDLQLER